MKTKIDINDINDDDVRLPSSMTIILMMMLSNFDKLIIAMIVIPVYLACLPNYINDGIVKLW